MAATLENKLMGHKGAVYALDIDPRRALLYSGGGDGWLVAWPLGHADGQLIAQTDDQVFSMRYVDQLETLYAGTMNGDLYIIDRSLASEARRKVFHHKGIYAIDYHGRYLLTAGGDGKLGIWSLDTHELIESIALSHKALRSISVSPMGGCLAVGASDGVIYVLEPHSWQLTATIPCAHAASVFSLVFTDGSTLVSGGRDAHIKVWKLEETKAVLSQDVSAHWYTVNSLALTGKSHQLVSSSRDKTIRIWNPDTMQLLQSLDGIKNRGHLHSVNKVCWYDGSLYAASDDRTISVWKLA